jgi:hypothetical protein
MSRRVADTTPDWRIWSLLVAAGAIPWSLLWDFSWECTVGIDLPLGAPHLATYAAVGLAALIALSTARFNSRSGITIGRLNAPAGAWVIIWGAAAFVISVIFDRWWQRSYGLAAGIWHPPQLLKAAAFVAILLGIWIYSARLLDTFSKVRVDALIAGSLLALRRYSHDRRESSEPAAFRWILSNRVRCVSGVVGCDSGGCKATIRCDCCCACLHWDLGERRLASSVDSRRSRRLPDLQCS